MTEWSQIIHTISLQMRFLFFTPTGFTGVGKQIKLFSMVCGSRRYVFKSIIRYRLIIGESTHAGNNNNKPANTLLTCGGVLYRLIYESWYCFNSVNNVSSYATVQLQPTAVK